MVCLSSSCLLQTWVRLSTAPSTLLHSFNLASLNKDASLSVSTVHYTTNTNLTAQGQAQVPILTRIIMMMMTYLDLLCHSHQIHILPLC
ncbi:hypothetical protein F5Y09DRAFT_191420 [Xylaria sp. FL1042]|nr:hypothetical protein F5Y09DRAFT_191420 [Xylaria sp. FL1042]